MRRNQASGNGEYQLYFDSAAPAGIHPKNLLLPSAGEPDSGLLNLSASVIDMSRSWWGTTDTTVIGARVAGPGADSVNFHVSNRQRELYGRCGWRKGGAEKKTGIGFRAVERTVGARTTENPSFMQVVYSWLIR